LLLLAVLTLQAELFSQVSSSAVSPDQQQTTPAPDEISSKTGKVPGLLKSRFERLKKDLNLPSTQAARLAVAQILSKDQQLSLYSLLLARDHPETSPNMRAAASERAIKTFKSEVDQARTDKQVGAASSSSGSTSLTSQGSVPAILGLAVENGALEKSVSGTTITFRGRPVQVIQALQKIPFDESYKQIENSGTLGLLNRFSIAVSFDVSRGNTSGVFTGSTNQISGFSTRIELFNRRDPRSSTYNSRWEELRRTIGDDLARTLNSVYETVLSHPAFEKNQFTPWLGNCVDSIATPLEHGDDDGLQKAVNACIDRFPTDITGLPNSESQLVQFAQATNTMRMARQKILDYVGRSPILTLEYNDNIAAKAVPPQMQLPDNSNFKLIGELGLSGGGSVTGNVAATIFNSKPRGVVASQFRDLQTSLQLDIPINTSIDRIGNVIFSLAGKYERIPRDVLAGSIPGITSLSPDAALKGNLGLVQAKITFPVKGSGIKMPLSFTWANRTELVKEKEVRGNIGITFDMDAIVSRLKQ